MLKATGFAPPLIALLLGCSALSSTAQAGWFDSDTKPAAPAPKKDEKPTPLPAVTLDDSIEQAQMLRLAGNYPEALNHLSQLMLVATDDPRVISEYGKTLVSMGRADEAEKFLTRALQLQPDDWTVYSALGVAYDQIGNQKQAQTSYERALTLKPGEPSVLSNYALSRMLAKDPAMARKLADRAETANATIKDDKIARNIAMIRSMAPEADHGLAANTPAPGAIAPPVTAPVPHVAVTSAPLAPLKPAQPLESASSAEPQPVNQASHAVVMQPVPADPLAGPVGPKAAAANHAPRSLQANVPPIGEAPVKAVAKADAPKPAEPAKPASPAQSLEAKAVAKKPGAIAQAKAPASKDLQAKNAPAKPAVPAAKVSLALKAADVKPNAGQPAPKVLAPTPVKAADVKADANKRAATSKDAIPGLRLSANAY